MGFSFFLRGALCFHGHRGKLKTFQERTEEHHAHEKTLSFDNPPRLNGWDVFEIE